MPGSNIRTVCDADHECYLLAVDDDDAILDILGEIFTPQTGITLLKATSLTEALEVISTTPKIEIILLDLRLGDSDGIDTLKVVVEAVNGRTAIIAISGSHELEDEAGKNGAIDFWGKPLLQIDMIGRVKFAIMNQRKINHQIHLSEDLKREIAEIQAKLEVRPTQRDSEAIERLSVMSKKLDNYAAVLGGGH
jgi:DNA-binding NtrC family response regulator